MTHLQFASASYRSNRALALAIVLIVLMILPIYLHLRSARRNLASAISDACREMVVIEIDDASLAALGSWPFRIDVHLKLIASLCEARPKAVRYEFVFSSPDEAATRELISEIEGCSCPIVVSHRSFPERPSTPQVYRNLRFVDPGINSTSRRTEISLRVGLNGELSAVGLLAAIATGAPERDIPSKNVSPKQQCCARNIALYQFLQLPAAEQRELVESKIVFVGINASAMSTSQPCPWGRASQAQLECAGTASAVVALRDPP